MARGLTNRNPGNIRRSAVRYRGEVQPSRDPAFKQFETMAWGYRAIFVLLDTYRVRHGLRTLAEMIARWAPPTENRTDAYIRAVAERTGLPADRPLNTRDRATMIPVAAAISRVENGVDADPREVEQGWELFINEK
ncbi:MAG: structural protein P5 [Alistipes sp.]|nr:structural protein P5 [Alistipes sp.]